MLVFYHGGGGDKLMYRGNPLQTFCLDHGISVVAVNFRPNNQFPAPIPTQDAARAIQFLRSKAGEFNIDPRRVGVIRHFAGSECLDRAGVWRRPCGPEERRSRAARVEPAELPDHRRCRRRLCRTGRIAIAKEPRRS